MERAILRATELVAPAEEEAWDRRGARMADALEALLTREGGKSGQPVMVVHVDAATLIRGADALEEGDAGLAEADAGIQPGTGLAETEDGIQLTGEDVERLSCHAKLRWVLTRDGSPVAIGRAGRRMGGAMEDLVRFRDKTCRFVGCDRGWSTEAHHIRHVVRGGPTTLDNMVLLCGTHHRMLHRLRWNIRGDPGGELIFEDRRGRVLGRSSIGGLAAARRRC